jgi:hypothetical protein
MYQFQIEVPPGHTNGSGQPFWASPTYCSGANGLSGCEHEKRSGAISLAELQTGANELGVYAIDAVGNTRKEEVNSSDEAEAQESGKAPMLYVDHTPPVIKAFGGSLGEAAGHQIGAGSYTLSFGAEDGSSGECYERGSERAINSCQSGLRMLTVLVDGKKVDEVDSACVEPRGIPNAACFGFSGSWTMEGQKYGAGPHTITVKAVDWMGNESSQSMQVTVDEAPWQAVGPGTVNLQSGAYKLEATDASLASAGATLTVGRTYDSRELSAGATGPLGAQWTLSLPDITGQGVWQSLQAMPNGNVQAITTTGTTITFVPSGGEFTSPAGYQTLVLHEKSKSPLEYELADAAGDATIFKRASSASEEAPVLVPASVEQATGAGGLDKVTYDFTKTTEGIVEPTELIAPYPSSLHCAETLEQGCRALEFKYGTATHAEESESGWGE